MKRMIALLLALSLLCGCRAGPGRSTENGNLSLDQTPAETAQAPSSAPEATPTPTPTSTPAPEVTPEPAPSNLQEGVALAKYVYVHEKGVVFWCYDSVLYSALVDENGEVYDITPEASLPQQSWCLTAVGTDLYLGGSQGLCRMDMNAFHAGNPDWDVIWDSGVYDGFAIYGNYAYCPMGTSLYRVNLSTGSGELFLSDVSDYEVTTQGVYWTHVDGGLCHTALDSGETTLLTYAPAAASSLVLRGSKLYFWSDNAPGLHSYDLETEDIKMINLATAPDGGESIWAGEDYLIYTDGEGDCHRYDLTSRTDTLLDNLYVLPAKYDGCQVGDRLYYCYATSFFWVYFQEDRRGKLDYSDIAHAIANGATTAQEAASGSTGGSGSPSGSGSSSSSGSYNIADGLGVDFATGNMIVYNDYFSVSFFTYPEWDYEVINDTTIQFYYVPARNAGVDGNFVTIRAYDWGDNGYEEIPDFSIAGLDEQKKYVAIFPTDVRYDYNDPTQVSEYQTLMEWASHMDQNDPENPFMIKNP